MKVGATSNRTVVLITILIGSLLLSRAAPAQEPNEAQRQEDLNTIAKSEEQAIETIRPVLFGKLTGQELAIYKEIKFRVSKKDTLSEAWGGYENGQRIVDIDVGFFRQIYSLAQAYMIERAENKEVVVPYINYVVTSWRNGASFVKTPPDFANFDFDKVFDDPNTSTLFLGMNVSALAFLMAHEVGHHMLGHYDKPRPCRDSSRPCSPTDIAKLREMETAADAWAFKCLENAHIAPLGAYIPLMFGYYTTSNPIAGEHNMDHPADIRRITVAFQAMVDSLPAYRQDIEKEGKPFGITYDGFKNDMQQRLNNFEKELETDSPPVMPYHPSGGDRGSDSSKGPFSQPTTTAAPSQQTESPPVRPHPSDDNLGSDNSKGPFSQPTAATEPSQKMGRYCGDVYGRRYCAMSIAAPIGTRCGCLGIPGWGVTVP